jgi:hypothetical protein
MVISPPPLATQPLDRTFCVRNLPFSLLSDFGRDMKMYYNSYPPSLPRFKVGELQVQDLFLPLSYMSTYDVGLFTKGR